jgi:hypothetical protein
MTLHHASYLPVSQIYLLTKKGEYLNMGLIAVRDRRKRVIITTVALTLSVKPLVQYNMVGSP